jgi:hypothetical protein
LQNDFAVVLPQWATHTERVHRVPIHHAPKTVEKAHKIFSIRLMSHFAFKYGIKWGAGSE